jgi:hypothetical protein
MSTVARGPDSSRRHVVVVTALEKLAVGPGHPLDRAKLERRRERMPIKFAVKLIRV